VLREAVASWVNQIDTSDICGPHVANRLIREALAPYPDDLVIFTKMGRTTIRLGGSEGQPRQPSPHRFFGMNGNKR